jgi:hypothetical protein
MKSIELNGKTYKIEFDINSGCDMEDKGNKSIGAIVNDALSNLSLTSARLILWGALRKHYPDLTLSDAGGLITGDRIEILNACIEEMKSAGFFGRAGENKKAPPENKKA